MINILYENANDNKIKRSFLVEPSSQSILELNSTDTQSPFIEKITLSQLLSSLPDPRISAALTIEVSDIQFSDH